MNLNPRPGAWYDCCRAAHSNSDDDKEGKIQQQKGGFFSKIKKGWEKYGFLGVATYVTLYATTMTPIFFALKYDIFNAAAIGLDPVESVASVSHI